MNRHPQITKLVATALLSGAIAVLATHLRVSDAISHLLRLDSVYSTPALLLKEAITSAVYVVAGLPSLFLLRRWNVPQSEAITVFAPVEAFFLALGVTPILADKFGLWVALPDLALLMIGTYLLGYVILVRWKTTLEVRLSAAALLVPATWIISDRLAWLIAR